MRISTIRFQISTHFGIQFNKNLKDDITKTCIVLYLLYWHYSAGVKFLVNDHNFEIWCLLLYLARKEITFITMVLQKSKQKMILKNTFLKSSPTISKLSENNIFLDMKKYKSGKYFKHIYFFFILHIVFVALIDY